MLSGGVDFQKETPEVVSQKVVVAVRGVFMMLKSFRRPLLDVFSPR